MYVEILLLWSLLTVSMPENGKLLPFSRLHLERELPKALESLLDSSTTWAALGVCGALVGGAMVVPNHSALQCVLDQSNARLLDRWGQYQGLLHGILICGLFESMPTIT